MKKILFATTALVATAGVAAAEVSFGGYGRFGLRYDESADKETFLESRFRMNIDGSATTDGGVRFSSRVRVQADDNGDYTSDNAAFNAPRFSAEFEGLRIDVGNAGGALDNIPSYYGFEPGLSNFVGQYTGVNYGFTGYSSQSGCQTTGSKNLVTGNSLTDTGAVDLVAYTDNVVNLAAAKVDAEDEDGPGGAAINDDEQMAIDAATQAVADAAEEVVLDTIDPCKNPTNNQTIYARYAFDSFAIAASYTENASERWDVHFAYAADNWGVSLGYGENNQDQNMLVLVAKADVGAFGMTAMIGNEDLNRPDNGADDDGAFYGFTVDYDLGAATNIGFSYGDGSGDDDTQSYGIGFIHDLGGGVSIRGGIGQKDNGDSVTLGDLGVRFDF